jgi:hypothetical protein
MRPELVQELTEAFKFVDTDDGGEIDANELKFAAGLCKLTSQSLRAPGLLNPSACNVISRFYSLLYNSTTCTATSRRARWASSLTRGT